jgi:hypothetical protein
MARYMRDQSPYLGIKQRPQWDDPINNDIYAALAQFHPLRL